MLAREISEYRITLPDCARSITGHKTGRNMDQGRPFHSPRKSDNVLGAYDVCPESTFQCGIERNVSGRVDNYIHIVSDSLRLFFGISEVCFPDVAASNYHLVANEPLECATVPFSQWIKRWRSDDVVPEPCFRFLLRPSANGDVNLANVGKAIQQHAQRYFAEKARTPNQKYFPILV